jgi:hypothetical protein
MTDRKIPEAMDPTAPEGESVPSTTNQRPCYAAKQLITEVLALFPETAHDVREYNGRNVGLAVFFYGEAELTELLTLVGADPRVAYAQVSPDWERDSGIEVGFRNQPRTYDLRDKFGLDEAWQVLGSDDLIEDDDDDWQGGNAIYTSDDVRDGGGA